MNLKKQKSTEINIWVAGYITEQVKKEITEKNSK